MLLTPVLLSACIQITVMEPGTDAQPVEVVLVTHTPSTEGADFAALAGPTDPPVASTSVPDPTRPPNTPTATQVPPEDTPPDPTDTPVLPTSTQEPSPSVVLPSATPEPSPTPVPVTDTPQPAPRLATSRSYPAPLLLEPDPDSALRGQVRFHWQWDGPALSESHFFDLRIWSQQEEDAGVAPRGAVELTKETETEVDLQYAPATVDFGPGVYYWSVVVVEGRENPKVVGQWGEKRRLYYSVSGGGDSGWDWPFPRPPWDW